MFRTSIDVISRSLKKVVGVQNWKRSGYDISFVPMSEERVLICSFNKLKSPIPWPFAILVNVRIHWSIKVP